MGQIVGRNQISSVPSYQVPCSLPVGFGDPILAIPSARPIVSGLWQAGRQLVLVALNKQVLDRWDNH